MVTFAGVYAGLNMKMEMLPDINIPLVTVVTVNPGASPEEVLEDVTKPLEQRLRNLDGLNNVNSSSMENVSMISLEYQFSKDMSEAMNEVRDAVDGLNLPQGVQAPQVSRLSLNAFPILSMSVSSDEMPLPELTAYVEQIVVPGLEGVAGVADVQVSGQHVEQIKLTFKPDKLAEYGLQEEMVKGIIQGSVLTLPLGIFEFEQTQRALLVDGNIHQLDDLKQLPIPLVPSAPPAATPDAEGAPAAPDMSMPPGAGEMPEFSGLPTIALQEIADIEQVGQADTIARTNGRDSIGILIVKAADANTVEVVNGVKEASSDWAEADSGLHIDLVFDQGKPIEDSVHTMLNKALLGSVFAILIILLFMRNFRSTIIAVISIPLSLLIALFILNSLDISLNIMSLGAMTVAIGRVVDDSIVVIENIFRRLSLKSEQLSGKALISAATREMFIPILSSTIVTIAVFLPLGLVEGVIGEMFMPFALTVVFALLASLLVAITVVPMLAHSLFKKGLNVTHNDGPGKMADAYKRVLNWSLNHKLITSGLAVLLLVGSLGLTPLIGFSFLPEEEEKIAVVTYSPAPEERLSDVETLSLSAETLLLEEKDIQAVQYSVGGENPMNPGASRQALFFVQYDDNTANFSDVKGEMLDKLQQLDGAGEWKEMDMGAGGMGGSQMSLLVYGPDMATLEPVIAQIVEQMKEDAQFANVDSSISASYEQYRLIADPEKLSGYALTAGQVAMSLMPDRQTEVLTTVIKDGKSLNVVLNVEETTFADKAELENHMLVSPLGMPIALKDVVTIEEGHTPDTITRKNDRVYAQVEADVLAKDVNKVSRELQKTIDGLNLPDTVSVEFGGVVEQMNEAFAQLGLAIAAATAIVYFVLVVTFGGALTPLAILFSLPFTVIGALLGLFIAGETINVTALIGALMLIGIVVTNAIVLIDRVIRKEEEGLSVRDALLEAAGTRLRPILMTAIVTVGALLPLAFGFESGGLISKGLGITVIGGLISSTLLTLIIVPVVYEWFNKNRKRAAKESF